MIAFLEKGIEKITRVEYFFTIVVFLSMLLLMFLQVIFRYFIKMPFTWSEEFLRFLFIAATYFGCAIATKERGHIEINLVEVIVKRNKNPNRQKRLALMINLIRDSITTCLLVFISVQTYKYIVKIYKMNTLSETMMIPMWIIISLMFIGLALTTFHSLSLIILNINGKGPMGFDFIEEKT